jgi:hypothetical protein
MMKRLAAPLLVLATLAPVGARGEDRKLLFDFDFALANVNDRSVYWSNGREHQTKLPWAIVGAHGDVSPHVSFRVELNGVNESVKPEPFTPTSLTPFFFPNAADPAFGVTSNPQGFFKVDDYKNTGWDPYIQEAHLRRAFVDVHTTGSRLGLIAGRFFVPVGFRADEFRWLTDKDLTHIQRINSAVDVGALFYWNFGKDDALHGSLTGGAISGNGNPYHDYAYFDFTRGSSFEDTNSAVGGVAQGRLLPAKGLEVALSGKFNYVGSLIASDVSVQRSKHYDNAFVAGVQYRPSFFKWGQIFGEFASYRWGLRDTSAALLPGPPNKTPIDKNGYYVGLDVGVPLPRSWGTLGVIVTREELGRDDSLIAFLAAQQALGVTLGKKERSTIVKVYAELHTVTVFFFYNDLQNPFPQASAIEPISGPFAFGSLGDSKVGFGLRFRASF